MHAAEGGGLVWTEEQLALFLERPYGMIKRTWMAFPGLGKSKEIPDVITYRRQHQNLIGSITQTGPTTAVSRK